jgi:hypothetical protein
MEILISAMISIGKILIAAIALIGVALAAWLAWAAFARANVKHEPVLTEALHDGDDCDRDAGGDNTILDGGRRGLAGMCRCDDEGFSAP